jgi:hypothetical protein
VPPKSDPVVFRLSELQTGLLSSLRYTSHIRPRPELAFGAAIPSGYDLPAFPIDYFASSIGVPVFHALSCFARVAIFAAPAILGCRIVAGPPKLPQSPALVRDQLAIYSDFPVPNEHRIFADLVAQRDELSRKLELPAGGEPVHVYLFESSPRFRSYMALHHPNLPSRRAFFLETDTRLLVYAHWNDRVAEDLRHEVTHGYLHALVRNLPVWVDEGLAEYFEVPRGQDGINVPHVDLLTEEFAVGRSPDLIELETLSEMPTMSQRDYAEAWAWIHFLLDGYEDRRYVLTGYFDDLRRDGLAEPLSRRILREVPDAEKALVAHVQRVAARIDATETSL